MIMNTTIKYLILFLLAGTSYTGYAAGDDDNTEALIRMAKEVSDIKEAKNKVESELADLKKEKVNLEKQLKTLQGEIDKLRRENEKQAEKIAELAEQNKSKSDNRKAIEEPLKARIAELESEVANLNKMISDKELLQQEDMENHARQLMADHSLVTDSLENEIANLKADNSALAEERERLIADNNRKDAHLKELEVFEAQYLAKLSTSFDTDWAAKPYNLMNTDELDELVEMCNRYASKDNKIKDAAVKFSQLKNELSAYNTAVALNVSPYDSPKVASVLRDIDNAALKATPAHKQELGEASKNLKDYRVGVLVFQAMIEEVDQKAGEFGSHAASINPVRDVLEDYGKDLSKINGNPWLSAKYKEYVAELEKDCKKKGEARNKVMSLKTK